MFEGLSNKLSSIIDRLVGKGALTENDVSMAMREIRIALLEADVALPVVKEFIETVKAKAIGQDVVKSISAGQMVVKIVHDHLVEVLGQKNSELNLNAAPPQVIMLVGLQGAGKTTLTAKLGLRLKNKRHKKVLMASLDVKRPAAQLQLATLGEQANIATLPIVQGQNPVEITKRALQTARLEGFDVILLDTAGRLHIDDELMDEVKDVHHAGTPIETLLVVDALTGQDAVNVAKAFNEKLPLTGVVLTRVDGDARGGAALSMRSITGCPIKFLSTGEKLDQLDDFHPERVASRILDMGDVVSLVEKASEIIDQEEAEKMAKKLEKGKFDLDDLANQLKQFSKMGGIQNLLNLLPGMGQLKKDMPKGVDEKVVPRQLAIISSMTLKERKDYKVLNASRKKRIAAGSGTTVQDVNKLLKRFEEASKMMKHLSKVGKRGLFSGGLFSK
ncbi:MAG: signal recognition particle protein [Alphaproteobacteria bacterium]|nr:signal recognition particle protein [Alphaproteobacteria bacterium]